MLSCSRRGEADKQYVGFDKQRALQSRAIFGSCPAVVPFRLPRFSLLFPPLFVASETGHAYAILNASGPVFQSKPVGLPTQVTRPAGSGNLACRVR